MNGQTRVDENADAADSSTVVCFEEQFFSGVIGVGWVTPSCLGQANNVVTSQWKVRQAWPRQDDVSYSTPSITQQRNCSPEHATVEESAALTFWSTRICP
uniref:Uncharacterized protein n=1 Tax=Angiostrongylus cantonensis TaxID=6313 RepID=A0A0K0D0C7_ANGCA